MTTESTTRTELEQSARGRRCNPLQCEPARRTAVYRLYDRNQRLLYVGIAHDTKKRWREHAREKDWWGQVRWRTSVWHVSRLGAAIEEYCAIRYENPVHNKNREYDRRLGVEPGSAPGRHQPRPWRLHLLAAAMKYPHGGTSWIDADPHYAVVISRYQNGEDPGCVRIWFPQIPELGYWSSGTLADPTSVAEIHDAASLILAEHHGLNPGSFTLSVHNADGCVEPSLAARAQSSLAEVLPARPSCWRIVGRRAWPVARAVTDVLGAMIFGIGLVAAYNLACPPHGIKPWGIVLFGGAWGLNLLAWRNLVRTIRELYVARRVRKAS